MIFIYLCIFLVVLGLYISGTQVFQMQRHGLLTVTILLQRRDLRAQGFTSFGSQALGVQVQ